jgi:hypothetical protein
MNKKTYPVYFLFLFVLFINNTCALDADIRILLQSAPGQLFMARCGYKLLKSKGAEAAARSFAQAFNLKNTEQLVQFLQTVQAGGYYFAPDAAQQSQAYKQLLSTLEKHKTPVGTTLADWALRFLTVDALLLAQAEPTTPTDDLARVIVEQFIDNLVSLQRRFNFEVPVDLSSLLFEKERVFLQRYRQNTA